MIALKARRPRALWAALSWGGGAALGSAAPAAFLMNAVHQPRRYGFVYVDIWPGALFLACLVAPVGVAIACFICNRHVQLTLKSAIWVFAWCGAAVAFALPGLIGLGVGLACVFAKTSLLTKVVGLIGCVLLGLLIGAPVGLFVGVPLALLCGLACVAIGYRRA